MATGPKAYREELRVVRVPAGSRRTNSRKTPGYERDLLRDGGTNELLGPTESRPATEGDIPRPTGEFEPYQRTHADDEDGELATVVADALEPLIEFLVDLSIDAAGRGASRLWKWTKAHAPTRRSNEEVAEAAPIKVAGALDSATIDMTVEAQATTDIAEAPIRMGADEFRQRLLTALAAERYAADERALLARVQIDDSALPAELQAVFRAVLESPSTTLDETAVAFVIQFLAGVETVDGRFALVEKPGRPDAE